MKVYKKCEFCKDKLTSMSPGDSILILCETFKELDSVKQVCYLTRLREPRDEIKCYKTEADTKYLMVLIQAEPTTKII